MKAVLCKQWGRPDDLVIEEIDDPEVGEEDVLIEVKAIGINFPDVLMVAGRYQAKPPFPFIPGGEVSGIVKACGTKVQKFKPGDKVAALCGTGGLAHRVSTSQHNVFLIPSQMDFSTASSFMVAYGLAYIGLKHRAQLQMSETLLVHGASGGIGLAAVDMGRCLGAIVLATAGSQEKLDIVAKQGARHLINYNDEDFYEVVNELTQNKGVNVIYDPVGGDLFDQSLRCISWEGRILVIGFASGRIPEISVNRLLLKNLSIYGLFFGAYKYHNQAIIGNAIPKVIEFYEQGKITPFVSQTFAFEDSSKALNSLGYRESIGKIVVLT
ncbi:MAG: NADPH:quinone oxidoreductase family protein [Microscillaceae bacterium]|nr:NADPH:quinone oxidoreductase family protein [Microscillaceae bacterium]